MWAQYSPCLWPHLTCLRATYSLNQEINSIQKWSEQTCGGRQPPWPCPGWDPLDILWGKILTWSVLIKRPHRLSRCSLCTSSPSRFALTPTRGELNQFGVDLELFSVLVGLVWESFSSQVDQLPKSLQRLLFQSVETKQGLSKEELQSALKVSFAIIPKVAA